MDDILIKSIRAEDLVNDLQETFSTLRSHGPKLSPSKCSFDVRSGCFLGYLMTERGNKANLEKSPSTVRDALPSRIPKKYRGQPGGSLPFLDSSLGRPIRAWLSSRYLRSLLASHGTRSASKLSASLKDTSPIYSY